MKKSRYFKRKNVVMAILILVLTFSVCGCARNQKPSMSEDANREIGGLAQNGEMPQKSQKEGADPTPEIIMLTEPLTEPEQEQIITEHEEIPQMDPQALQIVFLGDSILDSNRDETGIAYNVGVACDANVYNLSIGGTCAAVKSNEPQEYEKWNSKSLVGITLMLAGKVDTWSIRGTRAEEVMKTLDVGNTDYFVIEYGLNDFLTRVPLSNPDRSTDLTTYVGALRAGVSELREMAPGATIILCAPNYSQFFNKGEYIGDGNILNNGQGTLFDYKGICEYVANEKGTLFMDAYLDLGINGYNAADYLEDGIHLTAAGRKLYAEYLSKIILSYEETKNN